MPKSTIENVLFLIISLTWVFGVLGCKKTEDKLRDETDQQMGDEKCGGDFEESSGTLDYYFENGTYPMLATCSWSIKVPMGSVISITFIKFETEKGYDYLYIGESDKVLIESSGVIHPAPVISSTNKVKVKFTSDWIFSYSGFALNWTTIDPPDSHLMTQCPPVLPRVTCPPPPAPVTCPPPPHLPPSTTICPICSPTVSCPPTKHCPPPSRICRVCPPTISCPPPPPTPTCPPPAACPERMEVPAPDKRSQNTEKAGEGLSFLYGFSNVLKEHCLFPWVFLDLTGECILGSSGILTADNAEAVCKDLGARLILPRDVFQLGVFMEKSEWIGDFYVGANDKGSPGHYHWHNGTSLPDEAMWKDFQREGEPGNSCVAINYFYGTEKLIASRETNCDKDKWRYICQK